MKQNKITWKAELITSSYDENKASPVYWSLTNDDKNGIRLTINVYKADKTELKAAKQQVKEFLKKLNS